MYHLVNEKVQANVSLMSDNKSTSRLICPITLISKRIQQIYEFISFYLLFYPP